MLLWEMGIHRLLNANVSNIDDLVVPERYARELGMVLAANMLKGIRVVGRERLQIPIHNDNQGG